MNKQKTIERLMKADNNVARVVEIVCVFLLAMIVIIISVSVFTRFVMFNPLNFANPLAKYLMLWLAFLGAGLAFRFGEHIAVDMFVDKLKSSSKSLLIITSNILISIFLIVVIYYGFEFALSGLESNDPLVFGISMVFPYLSVPVSFIYILFQLNISTVINLLNNKQPYRN